MTKFLRQALYQQKRNIIFDLDTLTACHGDTDELLIWAFEKLLLIELKLEGRL